MGAMRALIVAVLACAMGGAMPVSSSPVSSNQVTVTGEVIDTWCYVTEIMYAQGTAHHQCAVWCAIGGIPVSIKGTDGKIYIVLRASETDDASVAPDSFVRIETHQVTVRGSLYEKGGNNFLLVAQVMDDHGIVNFTDKEQGIQPFGD